MVRGRPYSELLRMEEGCSDYLVPYRRVFLRHGVCVHPQLQRLSQGHLGEGGQATRTVSLSFQPGRRQGQRRWDLQGQQGRELQAEAQGVGHTLHTCLSSTNESMFSRCTGNLPFSMS